MTPPDRSEATGERSNTTMMQVPAGRTLIVLVAGASAVIVLAGVRSASGIVGPAFLALMLTIAVHPIQGYIQRKGWPTWTGPVVAIITVYLVLLTLSVAIIASLARFATLLPEYQDEAASKLNGLTSKLTDWGVGKQQQEQIAGAFDFGKLAGFMLDLLGSLAAVASDFLFVVILLLFLGLDAAAFPRILRRHGTEHEPMIEALGGFAHGTRQYLIVSTVFGFIVAVIDTIALWALGVPAPVLWGLLAFITNYIPNIGFIIGLVPPAVLALLEGGWSLMIVVIVLYCVINFILQSVIQPRFVGDAVGLSTSVTFLSLVFWAWVLGPLGALLAVPLTLLAKAILVDSDPNARWLVPLLGGGTAEDRAGPSRAQD